MKQGIKQQGTAEAIEKYRKTAKNVYIFEGNFNTTVETIAATVKRFKRTSRKNPVVFVDYLQLIKPSENDSRAQTKETVDIAVNSLKILARDEKIPVVAISSFNRSYYNQPAAFNAFKESGSIEYSADTVLALQLQKVGEGVTDQQTLDNEKAQIPRKIQLVCLKNRGGQSTFSAYFDYFPKYEYFKEREKEK
jgi:replicative DNA helicase